MSQTYKGFTIPADLDTADNPKAFSDFVDSLLDVLVPPGTIVMFGSATAPAGWLACQGQSLATTGTYAKLFAAIGYTYGGAGAAFLLPNLVGKFIQGSGSGFTIAGTGGAASDNYLAEHTHIIDTTEHTHWADGVGSPFIRIVPGGGGYNIATGGFGNGAAGIATNPTEDTATALNAGSPSAHENRPPFVNVNHIIKV